MTEDEEKNGLEGKTVMLKTTKRILKIPKGSQNISETPREILNIPAMHITFKQTDRFQFIDNNIQYLYPLSKIEPNLKKVENTTFSDQKTPFFGQKTLHHVLKTYFGFYDIDFILQKCVETNNYQAASKIAYLDGHFSDSLGFQLNALKSYMENSVLRYFKNIPVKIERKSEVITTSCSLESIKLFNDDTEGGESLCDYENCEVIKSVSNYVNDFDEGENEFREEIINEDIIEYGRIILEFYFSQSQIYTNPILMQNILIKSIQFWLSNFLPVKILEDVLLKNLDKYYNPLSILLFCKNFNNNLGEGVINEQENKAMLSCDFLKRFSTKFCLELCSMVLKNVNKT